MAALCWSSREEMPHAQGKRNPSKTVGVAREHQRADILKPYSQKTSQSNPTRTTALSNSMKLSHARGATQDGWVMVESPHPVPFLFFLITPSLTNNLSTPSTCHKLCFLGVFLKVSSACKPFSHLPPCLLQSLPRKLHIL